MRQRLGKQPRSTSTCVGMVRADAITAPILLVRCLRLLLNVNTRFTKITRNGFRPFYPIAQAAFSSPGRSAFSNYSSGFLLPKLVSKAGGRLETSYRNGNQPMLRQRLVGRSVGPASFAG